MTIPFHVIQPPSALVMGPTGSGKTDCLATLIEGGLETFVIVTEPDGIGSLIDSVNRRKLDMSKLHWNYCPPTPMGWMALDDMIKTIGTMGFEQIQNIKVGVGKDATRETAFKFLNQLKNFKCERTGKAFGPVDQWENDRALVWDSLSGLNLISWMLTVGYKPAAHVGEWGVSMNFLEALLTKAIADRHYFFVLVAHIEREVNELTGATQTMVSTLGRKLAPKIPRYFSEVVLAKRTLDKGAAKFTWSTIENQMDLKNRSLPIASDLSPSFVPIIDAYRRRQASIEAPPPPSSEPVVAPKTMPPTLTKAV